MILQNGILPRVTEDEMKKIIEYDLKKINDCLAKVGGELNHLVMLCHQGKIETLDLTKYAREIELLCVALNKKPNE